MSLQRKAFDQARAFFPESVLGVVKSMKSLGGLSGAPTYLITSETGDYFLKIQTAPLKWEEFIRVQEIAAEAGLSPRLRWMDKTNQVIITDFIQGVPLSVALGQESMRMPALKGLASQLVHMQSLDISNLPDIDSGAYARDIWLRTSRRPGFPAWALHLEEILDEGTRILARNHQRGFSHGDMNPSNVLWDGTKAWFVDWEKAGSNHPYLDMAVISNFLSLPSSVSLGLFEACGLKLMPDDRETFLIIRRFTSLVYGLTFLDLIHDLTQVVSEDLDAVPDLRECFARMSNGQLDLRETTSRALIGFAFLKQSRVANF